MGLAARERGRDFQLHGFSGERERGRDFQLHGFSGERERAGLSVTWV